MSYKIGYIDENESQVKLYRRKLRDYDIQIIGYEFKKGMLVEELMKQVYDSDIDLLMIDYKLKGTIVSFNGEKIEKELYENKPQFPYIIFTSRVEDAEGFIDDLKTIYDKEEITIDDKVRNERFVTMLKRSIEQYKNNVAKKKAIISELLEKGENEGLSVKEKDLLFSKQEELSNLDLTKGNEIPKHLITNEKLEDLSKTKRDAEDFLNSLIDKRRKK